MTHRLTTQDRDINNPQQQTRSQQGRPRNNNTNSNSPSASRWRSTDPFPDALPGRTAPGFDREFVGTVIVDGNYPKGVEQFYELVDPYHKAPAPIYVTLSDSSVEEEIFSGGDSPSAEPILCQPTFVSTGSATTSLGTGGRGSRISTSSTKKHKSGEKKAQTTPKEEKNVLMNGGYVIFTDDFIETHPDSNVAVLTQWYRGARGGSLVSPVEDPSLDEVRKKKIRLAQHVQEAEEGYRPVFRRISSTAYYGSAQYIQS